MTTKWSSTASKLGARPLIAVRATYTHPDELPGCNGIDTDVVVLDLGRVRTKYAAIGRPAPTKPHSSPVLCKTDSSTSMSCRQH